MATADAPLRRLSGDVPVPTPSELAAMFQLAHLRRRLAAQRPRLAWTTVTGGGRNA